MHTRTHTQGSIYKKPLTQLFLLSCVQKKQLPKKHLISSKWYTEPLTVLCISRGKKNGSKIRGCDSAALTGFSK